MLYLPLLTFTYFSFRPLILLFPSLFFSLDLILFSKKTGFLLNILKKFNFIQIIFLLPALGFAQDVSVNPTQVVDAMERLNGISPGERRNHINGLCASGSFIGSKEVLKYSRSALFSGKKIPVIARFSLAGGNPKSPDAARSPRGLALEFRLPGNKFHHFTMLNVPVFGASTPQTFYDSILANLPDANTGKADPEKIKNFKLTHPDALSLGKFLAENNPPISYANSDFFGIHTFKFVNKQNETTLVRWHFIPEDGIKRLSNEEMATTPVRFLNQNLMDRVKTSTVSWKMILTIGELGDEENDPTVYWPENRKELNAGVLTIKTATPQTGSACENINFDPLVMSDGVLPTNDPILLFRSGAYADSYAKRLTGK